MKKEKSKEYQYLDLAYRAVEYECGRLYTSLSDDDKKLFNETLKYLDDLIEELENNGQSEEDNQV